MSAFDVFGSRGASGANDNLAAANPSAAARRKLTDAAQGLGSGIVAGPLRVLHEHRDHLDRPLVADLAERTADALAAGAVKRHHALYAETADALGAWPALSDETIVNQIESSGGNKGFCAHILLDGANSHPFMLTGKTVCGKDAEDGYVRLKRGAWHNCRSSRGVRVGRTMLQWCVACAARESEHPDCQEPSNYSVLGAAADTVLAKITQKLRAELPAQLAGEAFQQIQAYSWADTIADEAMLAAIAAAAEARGSRAVTYALRTNAATRLEEMLQFHHGLKLSEALPDANTWREMAGRMFDSARQERLSAPDTEKMITASVCKAAARRSGKSAAPRGFKVASGA